MTLTRAALRLALLLTLALTAAVGLALARSPDDTALSALLLAPDGCAGPCWRHIQPGRTTAAEAWALLMADPDLSATAASDRRINWSWREPVPFHAQPAAAGMLLLRGNAVAAVVLPPAARLGDLFLLFGPPSITGMGRLGGGVSLDFMYPQLHITFTLRLACPARLAHYWHAQPEITIARLPNNGLGRAPIANPRFLSLC